MLGYEVCMIMMNYIILDLQKLAHACYNLNHPAKLSLSVWDKVANYNMSSDSPYIVCILHTHTLAHYCLRIFSSCIQMRFAPISAFQLALPVLPTANKSTMNFWSSSSKSIMTCTLKNAWKQQEGIACTQTLHMVHVHQQKQVSSLVLNYKYCLGINNNSLHINYAVQDKFCVMLSDGTERCTTSKKKSIATMACSVH